MNPRHSRSNSVLRKHSGGGVCLRNAKKLSRAAGMTLLELLVACSILVILSTVAVPMVRVTVVRHKESDLRYDLREIRDAIDRYKDDADKNLIQAQGGLGQPNTEHYPPDLSTLVKGVQLTGAQDKRVHYLREIPTDPITGNADWGLRSVEDDPDTTSWGGQDVFDVYSKATGTALDGTKYGDW